MRARIASVLGTLGGSETGKAALLAGAMIINNVIALVISVVFARELSDYGALAALLSYLLILSVFGQALQVATARDGVLGRLGEGEALLATLRRWSVTFAWATVALTVISFLLRDPIASLVGVRHNSGGTWGAALGIPSGCAWLALSVLRGALQGIGDYRSVAVSLIGEQSTRLVVGGLLAAVGLGITGAFVGSGIAYLVMSAYCAARLRAQLAGHPAQSSRKSPSLARHLVLSLVPIAGLAVIQLLQNVDLIVAKHQLPERLDNSYAVAVVGAKVLIWVAIGAGFYLVPETAKRRATGADTRPVLLRTVAIIAVCAVPCLLIFAVAAHPLLAIVFGTRRAIASSSLLPLGAAFTVLACTYLAVQYMLARSERVFLLAIGAVAVIEPILLLQASRRPAAFATMVLAVQVLGAILAYGLALRRPVPASEQPELLGV